MSEADDGETVESLERHIRTTKENIAKYAGSPHGDAGLSKTLAFLEGRLARLRELRGRDSNPQPND